MFMTLTTCILSVCTYFYTYIWIWRGHVTVNIPCPRGFAMHRKHCPSLKGGNPPCTPLHAFIISLLQIVWEKCKFVCICQINSSWPLSFLVGGNDSIAEFCLGKLQTYAQSPSTFFASVPSPPAVSLPKCILCCTCKLLACDFNTLPQSHARLLLLIWGGTATNFLAICIQFYACDECVQCTTFYVIYWVKKIAFVAGYSSMMHD